MYFLLEYSHQSKAGIKQKDRVSNQDLLIFHVECRDKQGRGRSCTPSNTSSGHNEAKSSSQPQKNRNRR